MCKKLRDRFTLDRLFSVSNNALGQVYEFRNFVLNDNKKIRNAISDNQLKVLKRV